MTEEERGGEQRPDRKKTWLRVLEFLCLFLFMATHTLVEYNHAPRWLGVALTVLFGVGYGLLNIKRQQYSRRRLAAELAGGGLLAVVYIYLVFFLQWDRR